MTRDRTRNPGFASAAGDPDTHVRTSFSRRRAVGLVAMAAASMWVRATLSDVRPESPLAIRGYDPVAYFTDRKPTHGAPDLEYDWQGLRYRFSSAKHRELFIADPARYAPRLGNYCAMALSKGELVEADPENWLISDGQLYVFGKAVGPELFQKALAGNIASANRNRTLLPKQ